MAQSVKKMKETKHFWEMRDAQTKRGNLSLSHNLVIICINCIYMLSTAPLQFKMTFWN